MSSYALNAIQLMTPSTFRRRNGVGRTRKDGKSINGELKNPRLNRLKSRLHSSSATNHQPPPNTLTICDTNTNGAASNFGLSQLTMSQLSDPMSHHHTGHTNVDHEYSSSKGPSRKSRRATYQSRPSARNYAHSDSSTAFFQDRSSKTYRDKRRSNSSSNGDFNFEFQNNSKIDSRRQSVHPKVTTFQDEGMIQSSSSQRSLYAQKYHERPLSRSCLSPRGDEPTMEHHDDGNKNSITPLSTQPQNNRKRSWMEACMDVVKSPFRTGKALTQQLTFPRIKIDLDDDAAENENDNHCRSIAVKTSDDDDNDHATRQLITHRKMAHESNELLTKLDSMKLAIQQEKVQFDIVKTQALGVIREEKMSLEKDKSDRKDFMKAIQSIQTDINQKIDKFSVEVWSAEEKYNAKVHHFEAQCSGIVEDFKKLHNKSFQDISSKESDICTTVKSKISAFDNEMIKVLNEAKAMQNSCKSTLTEMKQMNDQVGSPKKVRASTPSAYALQRHNRCPQFKSLDSAQDTILVSDTSNNSYEPRLSVPKPSKATGPMNFDLKVPSLDSKKRRSSKYNLRSASILHPRIKSITHSPCCNGPSDNTGDQRLPTMAKTKGVKRGARSQNPTTNTRSSSKRGGNCDNSNKATIEGKFSKQKKMSRKRRIKGQVEISGPVGSRSAFSTFPQDCFQSPKESLNDDELTLSLINKRQRRSVSTSPVVFSSRAFPAPSLPQISGDPYLWSIVPRSRFSSNNDIDSLSFR